ncbi:hypothetical protein WMF15_45335 [Sorangium sp. So ce233]
MKYSPPFCSVRGAKVLVLGLDGLHRVIERLADVGPLGELEEAAEAGLLRDEEDTLGVVVVLADAAAAAGRGELLLGLGEAVVGVLQEDQREDRRRVLGRLEGGVGPELVGGGPEALLEVGGKGYRTVLVPEDGGRESRLRSVHRGGSAPGRGLCLVPEAAWPAERSAATQGPS